MQPGTLRWRVACLFTSAQSCGCSLTRGCWGAVPSVPWHQMSEFKSTTVAGITLHRDLSYWGKGGSWGPLQVLLSSVSPCLPTKGVVLTILLCPFRNLTFSASVHHGLRQTHRRSPPTSWFQIQAYTFRAPVELGLDGSGLFGQQKGGKLNICHVVILACIWHECNAAVFGIRNQRILTHPCWATVRQDSERKASRAWREYTHTD